MDRETKRKASEIESDIEQRSKRGDGRRENLVYFEISATSYASSTVFLATPTAAANNNLSRELRTPSSSKASANSCGKEPGTTVYNRHPMIYTFIDTSNLQIVFRMFALDIAYLLSLLASQDT